VGLFAPIRDYIDALVHPSAREDALTCARHRAFIAPRLLGSLMALAALPLYLGMRGVPSVLELVVFAWLVAPILIAFFLSRTGRYESAHLLSSLALTGIVTVVAFATGGIASFAAIWLVVVPLEASLSASRRVVAVSATFALAAAGSLLIMGMLDMIPHAAGWARGEAALTALGIVSAALYATGLALGTEALTRTSVWMRVAEEDRYRLLARNMTDVISRHGRSGTVQFVSPAAEALFGVKVTELMGHGLFDRVHVADRPAYLTALDAAAAGGESRSVEFRVRGEGARFVWVEMRCRPLEAVAGEVASSNAREVVAVTRDISERKAQEETLAAAHAEAERANVAKSRFLATMSHELRTPLNAIIGFSEMLAKEESLPIGPERRHEYAHLINESGHHLLSVVNSILDMSKIETGNFEITPEPFVPEHVITDACDMLALKAREAGVTLTVRIAEKLPQVVADRRALSQIMLNLLANAIKFTPRGGRVTVTASAHGAAAGATIMVAVEDSGVGIAAEDLPRVGNPFFQARASYDRRHDGTGLGLSIVKGLVALHGGRFAIESRLGEGTRVVFHLPVTCERSAGATVERLVPRAAFAAADNIRVKRSA